MPKTDAPGAPDNPKGRTGAHALSPGQGEQDTSNTTSDHLLSPVFQPFSRYRLSLEAGGHLEAKSTHTPPSDPPVSHLQSSSKPLPAIALPPTTGSSSGECRPPQPKENQLQQHQQHQQGEVLPFAGLGRPMHALGSRSGRGGGRGRGRGQGFHGAIRMAAGPDDIGGPGFAAGRGKRVDGGAEVGLKLGVDRNVKGSDEAEGSAAAVEEEVSDDDEDSSDGEETDEGSVTSSENEETGLRSSSSDDGKAVYDESGRAYDRKPQKDEEPGKA